MVVFYGLYWMMFVFIDIKYFVIIFGFMNIKYFMGIDGMVFMRVIFIMNCFYFYYVFMID